MEPISGQTGARADGRSGRRRVRRNISTRNAAGPSAPPQLQCTTQKTDRVRFKEEFVGRLTILYRHRTESGHAIYNVLRQMSGRAPRPPD